MEPKNDGFPNRISFGTGWFSGSMLNFRGGKQWRIQWRVWGCAGGRYRCKSRILPADGLKNPSGTRVMFLCSVYIYMYVIVQEVVIWALVFPPALGEVFLFLMLFLRWADETTNFGYMSGEGSHHNYINNLRVQGQEKTCFFSVVISSQHEHCAWFILINVPMCLVFWLPQGEATDCFFRWSVTGQRARNKGWRRPRKVQLLKICCVMKL